MLHGRGRLGTYMCDDRLHALCMGYMGSMRVPTQYLIHLSGSASQQCTHQLCASELVLVKVMQGSCTV